jgi:hypothetical protein
MGLFGNSEFNSSGTSFAQIAERGFFIMIIIILVMLLLSLAYRKTFVCGKCTGTGKGTTNAVKVEQFTQGVPMEAERNAQRRQAESLMSQPKFPDTYSGDRFGRMPLNQSTPEQVQGEPEENFNF